MHIIRTEGKNISLSVTLLTYKPFIKQRCTTAESNGGSVCCLFNCLFPAQTFSFQRLVTDLISVFPVRPSNGFQGQWQAELMKTFIYWKDRFKGTVPHQWGWWPNKLLKVGTFSTPQPQLAHPEHPEPCAFDPPPPCFPPAEFQKAQQRDSEWEACLMRMFFLLNMRKTCRDAGNCSRILFCCWSSTQRVQWHMQLLNDFIEFHTYDYNT